MHLDVYVHTDQDIIQKQLESNKSYEQRTHFSQSKIMKRKEAKCVYAYQASSLLHAASTRHDHCCILQLCAEPR